jgi:hypothetical protein
LESTLRRLNRYGDGDIHWVTEDEGREIARAAIEAAIAAERAAIVALVEEVAATADKEFHSIVWHHSGRDQSRGQYLFDKTR